MNGGRNAVQGRPQKGGRYPGGGSERAQTGNPAAYYFSRHHDRGFLRDFDRGREAQDQGRRQADWPQGGAYLEGDAALLDDRRTGLWIYPRRPARRRWRQGQTRALLQAAGRGG